MTSVLCTVFVNLRGHIISKFKTCKHQKKTAILFCAKCTVDKISKNIIALRMQKQLPLWRAAFVLIYNLVKLIREKCETVML